MLIFLCFSFIFSLVHQDFWYYNYFQAVCLNAKFIHAKFFTENNNSVGNYMFEVSNRNTIPKCEICSKLIKKTPEQRQ